MSSFWSNRLSLSLYGQSHADAVGVTLDGLPSGYEIDLADLQAFLQRRAPGKTLTSSRAEPDKAEILSGLYEGKTCGAPFSALIRNTDARPSDYEPLRDLPRPGHADLTARARYGDGCDLRGGGHLSGRLTAPLCIAGNICMQILRCHGIRIGSHLLSVGTVHDRPFDRMDADAERFSSLAAMPFPTVDPDAGERMEAEIRKAVQNGDSIGGCVECAAVGLPAGVGDPMFFGLENRIAAIVFAIPGVRGIAFGDGFAAASLHGSAHNDPYTVTDGTVHPSSNHAGGICGGISTGLPVLFTVPFKPTPSVSLPQETVNLKTGQPQILTVGGRHDPCIALRALPCVEAATAIAVLDACLEKGTI